MCKRFVSLYFSASLACMIPFPGRFAYGLILVVELFALVFAATLLRDAIRRLERNMNAASLFSGFALAFFLLRDIVGFGTITYIGLRGIAEKVLFDSERIAVASFFATIPGSLIALSFILVVALCIASKSAHTEKAEASRD